MMAASLLTEARAAGLRVEPRGENLWVEPINRLTSDLRARLVEHKPEIIAYLRQCTEESYPNPLDPSEVLAFPLRLLGSLPLPPTLVLTVEGIRDSVLFDFRPKPSTWRRQTTSRYPTFEPIEIEAITEAAENGVVRPRDFVLWCQRKQREPYWRLDRTTALRGERELIRRPAESKNWTVGRLLDALGAKLRLINIVYQGAKTASHGPYAEATQ